MLGRYDNDAVTDTPTRSQMAGAASEGSAMVGHSRAFHSPAGMSVFGQSVALTHFRLGWRYFLFLHCMHCLSAPSIIQDRQRGFLYAAVLQSHLLPLPTSCNLG